MFTVENLIKQLKNEDPKAPILWQYYLKEHTAGFTNDQLSLISHNLMTSPLFLEAAHDFFSEWIDNAYDQTKKGN
jgi:hypothetical protein